MNEVAYETSISISDSQEIVDTLFRILTNTLINEEEVKIANFATFKVLDRPPRPIRTSTGEVEKGVAGKQVKVRMSESVRGVIDPAFRGGGRRCLLNRHCHLMNHLPRNSQFLIHQKLKLTMVIVITLNLLRNKAPSPSEPVLPSLHVLRLYGFVSQQAVYSGL